MAPVFDSAWRSRSFYWRAAGGRATAGAPPPAPGIADVVKEYQRLGLPLPAAPTRTSWRMEVWFCPPDLPLPDAEFVRLEVGQARTPPRGSSSISGSGSSTSAVAGW